jgi:branched-chain amino acid transport system permease protein
MDFLLQLIPHLVNGVSLGLLFALIALGFMLIVGVMETINLAHGSLFALGMYFALFLIAPKLGMFPNLQAWYMSLPLGTRYLVALILAPILVGIFGMLLELCMRRTYGRDPLYGLLLTFGAALVIEETIRLVWGSSEKQLMLPEVISGAFLMGDLVYSKYRFFASGFAILMIVLLWVFCRRRPTAPSSRPARTTAKWCAPWASTSRACASLCLAWAWRWRPSPAWSWRRSGAYARMWAWMRSCRLS